jgi:hypothetical protein
VNGATDAHRSRHDGSALTEGNTHSFRTALRLSAAGVFALTIAVSVWLLVMSTGGEAADCATAQQMWTYC